MESVFHTNLKKGLLSVLRVAPFLLLLLLSTGTSAEEGAQEKNSHCHNYAGGHVYPGEAFRVPVSDHSLHLSKAKSEFFFPSLVCGTSVACCADVRLSSCRVQTAAAAKGMVLLFAALQTQPDTLCLPHVTIFALFPGQILMCRWLMFINFWRHGFVGHVIL